jgi:hypothetical protein
MPSFAGDEVDARYNSMLEASSELNKEQDTENE